MTIKAYRKNDNRAVISSNGFVPEITHDKKCAYFKRRIMQMK